MTRKHYNNFYPLAVKTFVQCLEKNVYRKKSISLLEHGVNTMLDLPSGLPRSRLPPDPLDLVRLDLALVVEDGVLAEVLWSGEEWTIITECQ